MIIDFQNIWNSCSHWFEQLTAPVKVIAGLVTIIGGCWTLKKILREIPIWRKTQIKKLRNINGGELLKLVKSNRFIPTMGQTDPPHINNQVHASSNRFPLINHILKDLFDEEKSLDDKRYMILGGSGMGKSTFSVALFYKYIYKNRFKKSPYPIYIKSLSYQNVIQEIKDLEVSIEQNAIIILDALDERSFDATNDLSSFMEQLEEATRNFLAVIITCRTQFFPDGESEPDELKIRKKGGAVRTLRYEKIYISPITEKESNRYLRKRFGLNILKYFKAKKITHKCDDILFRPMILSFIGDLMKINDIRNLTIVEIYSHIIDKWFDREIEVKPNDVSKTELFSFLEQLSLYMYNRSSLNINDNDYNNFIQKNGFGHSPFSFKARSLINRNNEGEIKFSHKSFWEYFLAISSYKNPGKYFTNRGFTMATRFVIDLCSLEEEKLNKIIYQNSETIMFFPNSIHKIVSIAESNNIKGTIDKSTGSISFLPNEVFNKKEYEVFFENAKRKGNSMLASNKYIINDLWLSVIHFFAIPYIFTTNQHDYDMLYSYEQIKQLNSEINGLYSIRTDLEKRIIHEIQNCFIEFKNIKLQTIVDRIKKLFVNYIFVEKQLGDKDVRKLFFIERPNIVFPFFYSNTLVITPHNTVNIGRGFSSYENETIDFISAEISSSKKYLRIFISDEKLENIVNFISKCIETIDFKTVKTGLVFDITYNNKNICYLLDERNWFYTEKIIKQIINNMLLSCKKQEPDTIN